MNSVICHAVLVDEIMFFQSREVDEFVRGGADEALPDCLMAAWSKNCSSLDATLHIPFADPCAEPWRNAYPARQPNQNAVHGCNEASVHESVVMAPM